MKKVLFIEDDPSMIFAVSAMLKSGGFEVHHTLDEDEIRELAPVVDLVVSDYHFGIPGFSFEDVQVLCQELNKPLILQTGGMVDKIHQHQLFKPYKRDDLLKMIAAVLH